MEDKITELYNILNDSKEFGGIYKTPEELRNILSDETKVGEFYNILNDSEEFGGIFPDLETFKSAFPVKKKELSFLDIVTTASGKEPLPFLGQSKASSNQPQPSPLTDKGSYGGDILERIGAGAIDIATSAPSQLSFAKRILDIPKKIAVKELEMLGLSKENAEKVSGFIPYLKPPAISAGVNISNEAWNAIAKTDEFKNLEEKAVELRESSARYDKTIKNYIQNKEYNKAVGAAFLNAAESFPLTLAAMFGGGIGLGAIGSYSASAQYDELSSIPDMTEAQKITNALINGGLEIATERLGSANYGRLIKDLYKSVGMEMAEEAVKKGLKTWFINLFKKVGLFTAPLGEGMEEAINQYGSNITARITGEDPDRPLDYGVVDSWASGTAGGTTFIAMGLPGQLRQQQYEKQQKEKEKAETKAKPKEGVPITDKGTATEEIGELKVPEEVKEQKESELRLGDKVFETKEELFKHLDETAITEEGEMTYGIPNLGEYPSTATIRAVQEWTDKKNKEIELKTKEETEDAERIREEDKEVVEKGAPELVEQEADERGVRDHEQTGEIAPEEVDEFKEFADIVRESKTVDEAFEKTQEIKNVPAEISEAFRNKYDPKKKLTPKQAFEVFYNEIKAKKKPVQKPEGFTKREREEKTEQSETTPPTKDIISGKVSVYHGTSVDFTEFSDKNIGKTDEGWWGRGVYFHTDKNRGGYGNIIKEVKPNLKNPLIIPFDKNIVYDLLVDEFNLPKELKGKSDQAIIKEIGTDKFTEALKKRGYDGVIVEYAEGTKEVVVFNPNQVTIINQNINKPTGKPKEAISEEIPESEGEVPPVPPKPVKTPEKPPKGQKRAGFEKRETAKGTRGSIEMRKDEIGKIVKRIIDDNPHFYEATTRKEEIDKAKDFISSFSSFDNAYSNLVKKTKSLDELTVRHVARQVMLQKLGEDLRDSMKAGDDALSDAISDKIVNLTDITQKEIRRSATTLSMTMWAYLTPEATVFMVNKVINEANKTKLGFEAKQAEEFINEWGKEAPESVKRLIEENPELRDFIKKVRAKIGTTTTSRRVTKTKAKAMADKVRSLKTDNLGLTFADPIGATVVWNGALEVTAKTIETTGNVLQAIQDGIAEIKKSKWYKTLTRQQQKDIEKKYTDDIRGKVDFDASEYIEGQSWYKEAQKEEIKEGKETREKEEQLRKEKTEADRKLREHIYDVITSHWLVEKTSDKTLVDKLVEEVGLTKGEAGRIAKISEEAVRRDSQKVFERTLGRKIINTQTRNGAFDKFFNLIKRGVLTNENYYEVFAKKHKLREGLTEDEKIQLQKLAINVQQMTPYGYFGDLVFNEFLQYLDKITKQESWFERQGKLMVAVNYAAILMGLTTHKVNLSSAGMNLLIRPFFGVANPVKWADEGLKLLQGKTKEAHLNNPLAALTYAMEAYRRGLMIGVTNAWNIIRHGNIKEASKYMETVKNLSGEEIPPLEKNTFGVGKKFRPWGMFRFKLGNKTFLSDINPWNAFKYSGRTLLGEDATMFNTIFALELGLAARRKAILENTKLSPKELRKKILNEIAGLHLTPEQTEAVEKQLEEQVQMLRATGIEPTPTQIKQRRFEITRSLLDLSVEEEEELTEVSREEIFTGKQRGGIFSVIGDALGRFFGKHILIKMFTMPKIPFTGVLGRIADYSVDMYPGYGLLRQKGWSPTGIIARMRQWNRTGNFKDFWTAPAKYGMFKSAQMGVKGTPLGERQLARHYFGLFTLGIVAAVFLRDDDDIPKDENGHPIIDITGGLYYNTWDEREHHYLGAYTARIGRFKLRYLNYPIINVAFAIVGNYKDAVRAGEDDENLWGRLGILTNAWFRSFALIKDTWLAKGINDLIELLGGLMSSGDISRKRVKAETGEITDIVDIDGRVQRQLENIRDDYTKLPITYVDPLKSNLIQQAIKFTTPESRLKGTGLQLWAYNVGLQWWNDKRTDIFGQTVKTLPGDQGTAWPRKTDKRWEKMWQYNIHVRDVSSRDRITIKGVPQTLEWEQYIERKGLTQNLFRERFDEYFEKTPQATITRRANTEIVEGEYKTNKIDKDIRDIWSDTKADVHKYMFTWDKYHDKYDKTLKFLMEEGLIPDFYKPDMKDDNGEKIIFPYDKLEKLNDDIMKLFLPEVTSFLDGYSEKQKEAMMNYVIDTETGETQLEEWINHYYDQARSDVRYNLETELMGW